MAVTALTAMLDGEAPDCYDLTEAGRFACGECAENRDAAERTARQVQKANALLRLIRRAEVKPLRSEGLEDDATAQLLLGHVSAWAILKARIDLYFQQAGGDR